MTTMTALHVPFDGWTVDDLPDVDFRYELVDGALLVTPPPHLGHDEIAGTLADLLKPHFGLGWRCLTDRGVHFDLRNYREPDLVVYLPSARGKSRLEPQDIVLAVEVVSPSSQSNDRVAKPALYASAGIAHYWRIEQDPLELTTYVLEGDVYRESGRFSDEVSIGDPLTATFRLSELTD